MPLSSSKVQNPSSKSRYLPDYQSSSGTLNLRMIKDLAPKRRIPQQKKGGMLRRAGPAKSDYCYEKNNKQ